MWMRGQSSTGRRWWLLAPSLCAMWFLLGSLPVAFGADPTMVVVRRGADQALATAGNTYTVSWDTEVSDPDGAWASGTNVVVPAAWSGRVATVTLWASFEALSGSYRRGFVVVNGTTRGAFGAAGMTVNVEANFVAVSEPFALVTGDVITAQVGTGTNGLDLTDATLTVAVWGTDEVGSGSGEPGPTGPPGPTGATGPPCATPPEVCDVAVTEFTGSALDILQLAIFAGVFVGGFALMVLTWIAVQAMRR
jgi:hypothetical protein